MGKIRRRIASVLTVLAIAMAGLVVGAPAASAASSPPAPTCNTGLTWIPREKAKCDARIVWQRINEAAAYVAKEKDKSKRYKINSYFYWVTVAPLIRKSNGTVDTAAQSQVKFLKELASTASESPAKSNRFLISLRDYTANKSTSVAQMQASSILVYGLGTGVNVKGAPLPYNAYNLILNASLSAASSGGPMAVSKKLGIRALADNERDKGITGIWAIYWKM
jgi:hypothetical protein